MLKKQKQSDEKYTQMKKILKSKLKKLTEKDFQQKLLQETEGREKFEFNFDDIGKTFEIKNT